MIICANSINTSITGSGIDHNSNSNYNYKL